MLLKFFRFRNHNVNRNPQPRFGEKPLIMQIIHAGGMVEHYYMAFPAALIIDKYPNFVLARPEIFRRPWDSVVPPEEILVPGQKYFVVPVPTVKKLHRRSRKPSIEMPDWLVCQGQDTGSSKLLTVGKPETVNDEKKKKRLNGKGLKKNNLRFSPSLTVIYETHGLVDD